MGSLVRLAKKIEDHKKEITRAKRYTITTAVNYGLRRMDAERSIDIGRIIMMMNTMR